MGHLSPGQVALLILAALSATGVVISLLRRWSTFAGYEEIADEVRRLAQAISAEVFRDGADVVVSGRYKDRQAVVRFSNAENTPGLNLRMPAATTFHLSVAHASARVGSEGGRILVRTGNANFDARFATRTDHFTEAKLFLGDAKAEQLQKLACSNNTFLTLSGGVIELSELVIPDTNTCGHVLEHLESMAELEIALRAMPGSDRVKVVSIKRERQVAGRIAIAVGVAVALGSVLAATKMPSAPVFDEVNATLANGIPPADAVLIRDAQRWRVAGAYDLDPTASAWLRNQGQQPAGRIKADFSGLGSAQDVAYLLIGPNERHRIAILAKHANHLDGEMMGAALIARIPKGVIGSIQWKGGKAPDNILGDGLLVVQQQGNTQSAVVFFLSPSGTVSGAPVDYQQINAAQ